VLLTLRMRSPSQTPHAHAPSPPRPDRRSRYSSFLRSLSYYSFVKVSCSDDVEYMHPQFRRGEQTCLTQVSGHGTRWVVRLAQRHLNVAWCGSKRHSLCDFAR